MILPPNLVPYRAYSIRHIIIIPVIGRFVVLRCCLGLNLGVATTLANLAFSCFAIITPSNYFTECLLPAESRACSVPEPYHGGLRSAITFHIPTRMLEHTAHIVVTVCTLPQKESVYNQLYGPSATYVPRFQGGKSHQLMISPSPYQSPTRPRPQQKSRINHHELQ